MVRSFETSGHKKSSLILEMSRPIGHEANGNAVGGAPINDGVCGVFRLRVRDAEKSLLVRMVVEQHQDVLLAAVSWPKVYVIELHEGFGLRPVDIRTKWAWYLLPSKGR